MGKKRRGRSVRNNKNVNEEAEELVKAPHSFVIQRGVPGGNVGDLTKDFRKVMEPFTASALKVHNYVLTNNLKDIMYYLLLLCINSEFILGA